MTAKEFHSTLLGLNLVGTIAWLAELSTIFGFIAAMMGAIAGVMLVCIRWKDWMQSMPVQAVLTRWRRWFPSRQ
jgi:hypothetical protein